MAYINSQSLEEIKLHGSTLFPISIYPVQSNTQGNILPCHWHKEFEFIYLADGEAIFSIDDNNYTLKSGDCLFVNSGKIHCGISKCDITKYYSIVFSTKLLTETLDINNKLFNEIVTGKYDIIPHFTLGISSHSKIISNIIEVIKEFENRDVAYELVVKSKLLTIFSIILRHRLYHLTSMQKNAAIDKKYNSLKQIISFIEHNYNNKMKLSDLSQYMNLTPQYICTFFKEMVNMSIVEYINRYRIDRIVYMLEISDLSITDIAIECGFDNISYFNRVFKKQMNCSPSEYRKKHYKMT